MTQSGCAYEEEGLDCLGLNMEAVRKEIRELAGFLWKVESWFLLGAYISYFSVFEIKYHDQKQLIKGKVYSGLQFQEGETWWQEAGAGWWESISLSTRRKQRGGGARIENWTSL